MALNPEDESTLFNSEEPVQKPRANHQIASNNVSKLVSSLVPTSVKSILPEDYSIIVWRNVMIFIYLHMAAIYGIYVLVGAPNAKKTLLWGHIVGHSTILGVTCGAHRLWCHKSYKAKLPLRIILAFLQTIALQNSIFEWSRDHRTHHKFVDTDADPHNVNRGFFFSHIGWLMTKKHKDVIIKGKTIDLSDLEQDPVVTFQRKYYLILAPLLCFVFPAVVPWYFWNESWTVSWNASIFRYLAVLHGTWCINSVCHMFGTKPFDKNLRAVENQPLAVLTFGESWHNYHHVFPWDYKAAEFGNGRRNVSAVVINFMARVGWAYDLKTVSVDTIAKRATRTGDGSRKYQNILNKLCEEPHLRSSNDNIWGWDDKDLTEEERKITLIEGVTKN